MMTSIWGWLIQTIEVSVVAVMILFLKKLFQDKLPPKWQYGIWIILLLSLLLPAGMFGTSIVPTCRTYIEAIKTIVETSLQSAYVDVYLPIKNSFFFLFIIVLPKSLTDYLFIVYISGGLFYLGRYCYQYYRLRTLLTYGQKPQPEIISQLNRICETYHFHPCQVIVMPEIPSAFVCGIMKPILVLPTQELIDDKIILHEMFHLKYKDSLQCVIWSCLKCIHWCNPFLHYVFHYISNDMEALCDQRVLEVLEGEQRRDYGRILLSMTNHQYPHAFATTSLSNGTKNIKKRIEAIARFKKYPQGMSIVSVCIYFLLIPVIMGSVSSYTLLHHSFLPHSFAYQLSMASARLSQCESVEGAIDTYAKGLLTYNEQYLLSVLPRRYYSSYQQAMKQLPTNITSTGVPYLYEVNCLKKINENEYHAYLCFNNCEFQEDQPAKSHYMVMPIQVIKENGWKVKQTKKIYEEDVECIDNLMGSEVFQTSLYKKIIKKCKSGQLELTIRNANSIIDSQNQTNSFLMNTPSHSLNYQPRAHFNAAYQSVEIDYINTQPKAIQDKIKNIYIEIKNLDNINDEVEFEKHDNPNQYGSSGGASDTDAHHLQHLDSDWNHLIHLTHCTFYYEHGGFPIPQAYALQIVINGEDEEILKIDVKDGEWHVPEELYQGDL